MNILRLELSSWFEHSNFNSNQHEKGTSCSFHSLSHSYTCLRLSSDMYIKPAYADMVNSKMSVKLKCRLKNILKAYHARRRQNLHCENLIRLGDMEKKDDGDSEQSELHRMIENVWIPCAGFYSMPHDDGSLDSHCVYESCSSEFQKYTFHCSPA